MAKVHLRRWYQAKELVKAAVLRPSCRDLMDALIARVRARPHLETIMVGYGGIRDAQHKAWLEAETAAGRKKKPGLAEIAHRSRSSMIRAVRQLVAQQYLTLQRGGGRTDGGDGRANTYQLGPACGVVASQLEAERESERAQAEPEADYGAARERIRQIREEWERSDGSSGPSGAGPPPS